MGHHYHFTIGFSETQIISNPKLKKKNEMKEGALLVQEVKILALH